MKNSMQVIYILAVLFVVMLIAVAAGKIPTDFGESIKAAMSLAIGAIAGILAKSPQE